jgi:gamma-glutamyltranspeptidase/glutathione hydrolase
MQVVVWNRATGAVEAGTDSRWEGVGKAADGSGDDAIFR